MKLRASNSAFAQTPSPPLGWRSPIPRDPCSAMGEPGSAETAAYDDALKALADALVRVWTVCEAAGVEAVIEIWPVPVVSPVG